MAIRYNPNMEKEFSNNIAYFIRWLRTTANGVSNIWNSKFPETLIGKQFNYSRSLISTYEGYTRDLYRNLISVRGDVENQVALYLKTEREIISELLVKQGLKADNLDDLSYEELRELFFKTRI